VLAGAIGRDVRDGCGSRDVDSCRRLHQSVSDGTYG
jgi:hypothetical protein